MAKKQREPFFTQMQFDNAMYAQDVKQKCEKKLERTKIGLIASVITQLIIIFLFIIKDWNLPEFIQGVIMLLYLVGLLASYILGGGLLSALKVCWKVAKNIGFFGWLVFPFPMDIVAGVMCMGLGLMIFPFMLLLLPLVVVLSNRMQTNKDYQAACDYLKYCTPVNTSANGTV